MRILAQQRATDQGVTDALLLQRLVEGDHAALDEVYARYARPAYALARRVTVDDGFAEDVVQEVFLALWRDPHRFDPAKGSFGSWLMAMVHHRSVDAVRREESLRRRRDKVAEQSAAEHALTPVTAPVDDAVMGRLQDERVRAALLSLPEAQRRALTLAYFGGYTQREVASLTNSPLGTVKTRMLTGMRRLRERLALDAPDVAGDPA